MDMSRIIEIGEPCTPTTDRSQFRLGLYVDEPVYLQLTLDGLEIDPIVEKLNAGEASFVCPKHFSVFYEGQMIGPAVLVLQDEGMAVVYPVVKSKNWPLVNVEFMQLGLREREMISRFTRDSV